MQLVESYKYSLGILARLTRHAAAALRCADKRCPSLIASAPTVGSREVKASGNSVPKHPRVRSAGISSCNRNERNIHDSKNRYGLHSD
jgi:hypothetical protein